MDRKSVIGKWVYIDRYRRNYVLLDDCVLGFNEFIPHWIGIVEDFSISSEGVTFYIRFNREGRDYRTHVLVSKEV